MSKLKQLHWISAEATPYSDYFFRNLENSESIDLKVYYITGSIKNHPWKDKQLGSYSYRYFSTFLGVDWGVLKQAMSPNNFIVITGWHTFSNIVLIVLMRFFRRKFIFYSDTPKNHRRRGLKGFIRRYVVNAVQKGAFRVMTTGWYGIQAWKKMGFHEDQLVNLPFFVDLEKLQRSNGVATPITQKQKLVFVSTGILLNRTKAFDVALKALGKAKKATGNDYFEYHLAGTGPDEDKLKELVTKLGLEEQVKFRGWMEYSEICDLLKKGDCFIHPAPADPYPVSVLEAMAAGLVVLGSDSAGSVVDRVENGKNGFIHKTGDVEMLAKQIESILEAPNELSQMGVAARATAEEWPVSRGVATIEGMLESWKKCSERRK